MENKKLAQGVKELRKIKGLSQQELAIYSGLSLRTIQRVENGETEPTGETLKRISSVFDVTPIELIDWDVNKETLKKTVKAKNEYLHIFDSKLIISKTPEIKNLVEDYEKSVNNVFKSLMVFFVSIPIFTALTAIFYNMGMVGLAIYTGAIAVFFLLIAFYNMLFTSGSSLIKVDSINKIKILRKLFNNVVVIFHKESGRLKKRHLIIEKNQVDTMKDVLLSEKLIEENDIKLKANKISYLVFILAVAIVPLYTLILNLFNNDAQPMMAYHGVYIIFLSAILLTTMITRLIKPLFNKTTNR